MPHIRSRYILENLEQMVGFSPLIGLLGHRQVGKTTVLSHFSKDYHTFDTKIEREAAQTDPDGYINSLKGKMTVLDEAQLAPNVFFALKERVRTNQKPGQFILSGSVRFTSKKIIQESLTGRIQYLELLPFSIAEVERQPLSSFTENLLGSKNFESISKNIQKNLNLWQKKLKLIEQYKVNGGLPGILFIRDSAIRKSKLQDQLRTILDRDLRQIYPTTLSYDRIDEFCKSISLTQGNSFSYAAISKVTGITPVTQQKLLYCLENLFLIRRIPIEGGQKGFSVIFEDQAESYHYSGKNLDPVSQLTWLLYRNIRTEFFYRLKKETSFFQYRTRAGSVVPLAIRQDDDILGFIPINEGLPSREEKAAGQSFLKTYRNSKIIFFHKKNEIHPINDRMLSLPIMTLV